MWAGGGGGGRRRKNSLKKTAFRLPRSPVIDDSCANHMSAFRKRVLSPKRPPSEYWHTIVKPGNYDNQKLRGPPRAEARENPKRQSRATTVRLDDRDSLQN